MTSKEWKIQLLNRVTDFSIRVIQLSNRLPKNPTGFAIAGQLIRSATAIGANIFEAQDASSTRDFIYKLGIALREARETYYWLTIIKKSNLIQDYDLREEMKESNELIAILVATVKTSKTKL